MVQLVVLLTFAATGTASLAAKKPAARTASAKGSEWFVESGGCRVYAKGPALARLKEMAERGKVTWAGRCVKGQIHGPGVLSETGEVAVKGRTKRYAYYLSGRADKGRRTGEWKRETMERFVDSSKIWTSLSRQNWVDGVAKGKAKLVKVESDNQHSDIFVRKVLDPERKYDSAAKTTPLQAPEPSSPETGLKLASADSVTLAGTAQAALTSTPVAPIPTPTPAATASAEPAPVAPPTPPSVATAPVRVTLRSVPAPTIRLTETQPPFIKPDKLQLVSSCHMDTLNDKTWGMEVLPVADKKAIRITGWALDDVSRGLAKATVLVIESAEGRRYFAPTLPVERPDVADFFKAPSFKGAGYKAVISAEGLPAGDYEVAVVMETADRALLCTNGRRLRL
ncbi:MAG: hypothetical protein IPG34_17550 [Rhodocyclaceae bacterium]|nr:hypothetical protein [Rhodocyclaceae bacterium]